jgi:hypothetical protein
MATLAHRPHTKFSTSQTTVTAALTVLRAISLVCPRDLSGPVIGHRAVTSSWTVILRIAGSADFGDGVMRAAHRPEPVEDRCKVGLERECPRFG